MKQPKTPQEWQEAVNLAHFWSLVHSAICYGLVTYSGKIDIERCDEILRLGRKRGVHPQKYEVDKLVQDFAAGAA
jgi:hypothetical protein